MLIWAVVIFFFLEELSASLETPFLFWKLHHCRLKWETLMRYGIWDQVRVDHGKEFYLVLAVQDHLKDLRNNTRRYPYLQTQSKQNHAVERLWVEINSRTNYPIKRILVAMENENLIDMDDEVTKFCISSVTRKVVQVGIRYAVSSWNSHPIPGKGIPLQMSCTNSRAVRVNVNQVPTAEQAVQMYQGNLNLAPSFGVDPLEQEPAKKEARERQFIKYFSSYESMFHGIVNENPTLFRNALLYYLRLTLHLSRQ